MLEPFSDQLLWFIIVGFIIAFILAFGIGANDVANSFGTSVGSKVLTIRQACCLATIFEIAGAILIGYKVSDTMRKEILEVTVYEGNELELMLGCLSALGASAIWLLIATFFKLPVSGSHSIVGATIGFSLVARGTEGIHWNTLITIVASWFISPLLSGLMTILVLMVIRHCILLRKDALEAGLMLLPLFYGFTIFVNIFSIVHDGPKMLYMDNIPLTTVLAISGGVSAVVMILVCKFVIPWQRLRINKNSEAPYQPVNMAYEESSEGYRKENVGNLHLKDNLTVISEKKLELLINGSDLSASDKNILQIALPKNTSATPLILDKAIDGRCNEEQTHNKKEDIAEENEHTEGVCRLFSFLQVLTATFGSFAHGGNDVSNAIGPLIALWLIYSEGNVLQEGETPLYILLYGGIGISVGLWIWGRRVIQTVGEDLTTIVPTTGFTIEIGAASTVLLASKFGVPISTTHCKVGSVVFVGYFNSHFRKNDPTASGVDCKLFRSIIFAWVVSVPIAAGLSAISMFLLRYIFDIH